MYSNRRASERGELLEAPTHSSGGHTSGMMSRLLRRYTRKSARSTVMTLWRGKSSLIPDETQIRQVGLAIRVPVGEEGQLGEMVPTVEGQRHEAFPQECQHDGDALQMKRRLRQDGLAGEQRFGHALRHLNGPLMVAVITIGEPEEKSGIRDALHERRNPLRVDRSVAPRTTPARRMNG
jgi:hypothetical protein